MALRAGIPRDCQRPWHRRPVPCPARGALRQTFPGVCLQPLASVEMPWMADSNASSLAVTSISSILNISWLVMLLICRPGRRVSATQCGGLYPQARESGGSAANAASPSTQRRLPEVKCAGRLSASVSAGAHQAAGVLFHLCQVSKQVCLNQRNVFGCASHQAYKFRGAQTFQLVNVWPQAARGRPPGERQSESQARR